MELGLPVTRRAAADRGDSPAASVHAPPPVTGGDALTLSPHAVALPEPETSHGVADRYFRSEVEGGPPERRISKLRPLRGLRRGGHGQTAAGVRGLVSGVPSKLATEEPAGASATSTAHGDGDRGGRRRGLTSAVAGLDGRALSYMPNC